MLGDHKKAPFSFLETNSRMLSCYKDKRTCFSRNLQSTQRKSRLNAVQPVQISLCICSRHGTHLHGLTASSNATPSMHFVRRLMKLEGVADLEQTLEEV